jgi:tetraacyldisaccharide 4'-kinase
VVLYLLYRGIRDRRYFHRLTERFGFIPSNSTGPGAIWFHAVSVGEVLAAASLIERVRRERPRIPVFLSTSTLAGRELADRKIGKGVFFAPIDYRFAVRRVLRRLRPALVVVLETEIWPNLYRESKRAGASLLVVNARISDRAWPRYRAARAFFRHVLGWPDAILAQSEIDAARFREIGASRVTVSGNLKYDFSPPAAIAPELAAFLDRVNPREIFIAASTMADDIDEDDAVIAAIPHKPRLLTIIAPRKPERFDIVAAKLAGAGVRFVRRTALADLELPGVLLLDSIGELAALFERADVVFMGGTLANRGGHNILEPGYFGKPIILGPHMENFAAIAEEFREATVRVTRPDELGSAIAALLDHPGRRTAIGGKAREIALSKRGVADCMMPAIWSAYAQAVPNSPRTLPARILLTPLSWIWRSGHAINVTTTKPLRLATPVISVGGLSVGGSGKTPIVAHLAQRLRERGKDPAILTRGYRRGSREPLIVPRGERKPWAGDEAEILMRRGDAHVGVSSDRFKTGQRIEKELAPDIFLLDDGFQHFRLARHHNIVLIDALDPLGGGVVPLGRLREPLDALARADTIIVTRVEPGQDIGGIERLVARYNSRAPVFRSRVLPLRWVGLEGPQIDVAEAKFKRAGAFCGLGSPRAFWRTLGELGIEPMWRREFRDHHWYTKNELERLKQGVDVLLTTEKDAMNLQRHAAEILAPVKLFWLRIGIEIEGEGELLKRISL